MKPMKLVLLSLATFVVVAANVRAQDYRTDINPALLYYKAFILDPRLERADRDYLFNTNWQGRQLTERFGQLVTGYDRQFDVIHQAAHSTAPCDWGIDWRPGPNTLLPQLARCKAAAIMAQLRVMWELQNGNEAEARDDLLAAIALGRNCSRDGTAISVLVQIAIENIVCSTIAENYYRISPDTLKQIADGFDAAPARGTLAAAITTEQSLGRGWMVDRIMALQKEHPGDDAKVMAEFLGEMGQSEEGQTDVWAPLVKAAGGTSDGLLKLLRDEEQYYNRLAVIMALPEPEYDVQVKDFTAEVHNSTNLLVRMIFPAFEKSRPKEFMTIAELAMMRAAAEYKLHGEDGLKSVMDPFGNGPFHYERFVFQGVDRGFKLTSAYSGLGYPEAQIFVETDGPPFLLDGPHAGQALPAQ